MPMIRGFKKVRCPHCGHIFLAADIEDGATVKSMDVHCPNCGGKVNVYSEGLMGILDRIIDWLNPKRKKEGRI